MWSDDIVLMIQVLRAPEVKNVVDKVVMDEDDVIYIAWNCWNIWYFLNSSSDISMLLELEGTCPSYT